jgi:hypothetical protein
VRQNTELIFKQRIQEESFGMQRLRRATPIALTLFLALVSGAFAGANAGATFSLTSSSTISGVGPGETVTLDIAGSGFVGIKNLDVYITVSDPAAFDLTSVTVAPFTGWFPLAGQLVSGTTDRVRVGAALLGAGGVDGDGAFSVNINTAAGFSADTEATITVDLISVGPSSSDRDEFATDALGIAVQLNPPVSDPTLSASTATDVSTDFSAVGDGDAADGSDGEVTFGVIFADETGAATAGQTITWTVTNNGAESIYVLGATVSEIAAGASSTLSSTSGADGSSMLVLDAEGDKFAGSTSASVSASTSADNSEGATLALSVDFSATWDVPVPAELASFAADVTTDLGVELRWAVSSQTNNLGWEVYRSADNSVFERVSGLIAGDGTSDTFRSFTFTDNGTPASDVLYYYLRQIDLNGTATRSSVLEVLMAPTAVLEQALPLVTELAQNYPNPFNPETTIHFDLATETSVTLRVYDMTGQVVRTLVQSSLQPGSYTHLWDGRNEAGVKVGSGVYFYQLEAGSFSSKKKMTLLQ